MRQKIVVGCLTAASAALLAIAFLIYSGQDKIPPEIQIKEKDITYEQRTDRSILMEGVTASDNRDGDLTERIFVDDIIVLSDESQNEENAVDAVVKYAVLDQAKNVGTAKRRIKYIRNEETDSFDNITDSQKNNLHTPEGGNESEEPTPLTPNGEAPAIRLHTNTMTIAAGSEFDTLSPIAEVVDDVDDFDTLYTRINLDGSYDTATPGSYELTYYVTDTSGNISNIENFILVVQ